MKSKITITGFFILSLNLFGCKDSNKSFEEIHVVETVMDSIIIPPVSWLDSSNVEYYKNYRTSISYSDLNYDSAIMVCYRGWDKLTDKGYFPINSNGQWINTIDSVIPIIRLHIIDSILKQGKAFKDTILYQVNHDPIYAIVYFKEKKILGQTSFGFNTRTVASSFTLGNDLNYGTLDNKHFFRILEFFGWTKL